MVFNAFSSFSSCLEIVTPYFCFYSGTVFLGKIKEAMRESQTSKLAKNDLIADYCSAMETKAFSARKNLIDKTIHGKPCIDSYKEVYNN
jgi:hypothetical protein